MPKRIAKSPAGSLCRIRAADVCAHADFKHHSLLRHRLASIVIERKSTKADQIAPPFLPNMPLSSQHAAFELGASGLEICVADITNPRHDDAALVRDDWWVSMPTADPPSSPCVLQCRA